jgi:4-hydroxybutyrate dehydrogenase
MYTRKKPDGKIRQATQIFADVLDVDVNGDVYGELEKFLNNLILKKPLRAYGMTEAQIDEFAKSTVDNQQRLLGNNYVFLTDEEIREIFANLY